MYLGRWSVRYVVGVTRSHMRPRGQQNVSWTTLRDYKVHRNVNYKFGLYLVFSVYPCGSSNLLPSLACPLSSRLFLQVSTSSLSLKPSLRQLFQPISPFQPCNNLTLKPSLLMGPTKTTICRDPQKRWGLMG